MVYGIPPLAGFHRPPHLRPFRLIRSDQFTFAARFFGCSLRWYSTRLHKLNPW